MLDLRPQTSDRLAGCGKSHESLLHCGRAALYRRVSRAKSARALAPEAANRLDSDFFRSLLERTDAILRSNSNHPFIGPAGACEVWIPFVPPSGCISRPCRVS